VAFRLHNLARMSRVNRALLVVSLLVAPALAGAQLINPGQVLFTNHRDFPMYVNATECTNNASVTVQWSPQFLNGLTTLPVGGVYQLYASSLDPRNNLAGGSTTGGSTTCFTSSNTTGNQPVTAGQVSDVQGNNPIITQTAVINLTDFVTKAGQAGCPSDNVMVWICVQGLSGGTPVAFASASVTISTTIPPPPVITEVTPGDSALNVTWGAGTATTTATGDTYSYQLTADMVGTTTAVTDPNAPHLSSMYTSTSARFGGLVNTVVYAVTARAFSKAGNGSAPSAAVNGTPLPVNDFWDSYKAAGGRDSGGCTSGLAGPLALALVAGALALSRRRR
jgi:hypothetical protein